MNCGEIRVQDGGRKGFRCRVCMGCGRCMGVGMVSTAGEKLHILAEQTVAEGCFLPRGKRLAAADIGTTTIAMLLYGEDGTVSERYVALNPQGVYGADVLSRIQAAEQKAAAESMRRQVLAVLEEGLERFRDKLSAGEELLLVLAANTTESYLLMGWDTTELGRAPFRVSRGEAVRTRLCGVDTFVFPCLSAFVGGDIAADLYACKMAEKPELTLLLDLGTNGELVLGNRDRRIACSTAAGPAFEGGVNKGIWGADLVSRIAALYREGLLDRDGMLAEPYFDKGIRAGNVCVTQAAVRAIQLAKAAIAAGTEILLEKYGVGVGEVERVILAGGFGYYLKPEDAAEIGLLSRTLAKKAVAGGNLVLAGARRMGEALLVGSERYSEGCAETEAGCPEVLQKIRTETETLNLAEEPEFAQRYLQRMELGGFF